jgi:hypothetical protein
MTPPDEEIDALESRLAALRASHRALSARIDVTRRRAIGGVPIRTFVWPFATVAAVGAALGLLAVELGKVIP